MLVIPQIGWALSALERFLGFIVARRREPCRKASLFSLVRSHLSHACVRSRLAGFVMGSLGLRVRKRYSIAKDGAKGFSFLRFVS